MSCDYAIWNTAKRLSSADSLQLYNTLCDGDTSGVLQCLAIDNLYTELTSLHPEIDNIAEDDIDNHDICPWSIAFNRSPGHILLSCVRTKADYVRDLIRNLSSKYDLTVFDQQNVEVYYPEVFYTDLLRLVAEDNPTKKAPDLTYVENLINLMNSGKGPSYFILEGRGLDYAQVFGGLGAFTVEWREYKGIAFQHWVAGYNEPSEEGKALIPGKTYSVEVQPNEQLSAEDAQAILVAYLDNQGRPEQYKWKDISDTFM